MPANDAIAGHHLLTHPEIAAAVRHELVDLLEGLGIEQSLYPLTSRQFALLMLLAEPFFATTKLGAAFEVFEFVEWIHVYRPQRLRSTERILNDPIWKESAESLRL